MQLHIFAFLVVPSGWCSFPSNVYCTWPTLRSASHCSPMQANKKATKSDRNAPRITGQPKKQNTTTPLMLSCLRDAVNQQETATCVQPVSQPRGAQQDARSIEKIHPAPGYRNSNRHTFSTDRTPALATRFTHSLGARITTLCFIGDTNLHCSLGANNYDMFLVGIDTHASLRQQPTRLFYLSGRVGSYAVVFAHQPPRASSISRKD